MNASRTEKTKDTYWTPEKLLVVARSVRGEAFALDPATDPRNPTGARRFAVCPSWAPILAVQWEGTEIPSDLWGRMYEDGLAQDWTALAAGGMVWVNPPFGREKIKFLVKAHEEANRGAEIQMITPCDPATAWWQRFASPRLAGPTAPAVCFLRQRPTFIDPETGAPPKNEKGEANGSMFGCQILYWGPNRRAFFNAWSPMGDVDLGPDAAPDIYRQAIP